MAAENLQSESGGSEGGNWDGLAPEVLEMIFCHLPVKDLLSCSVVSKNWKKAARDVLKRSRECYFHIKYFNRHIQNLNAMISSTGLMEMVNGLHIRNEIKPTDGPGSASSSSRQALRRSKGAEEKWKEAKPKVHEVLQVPWRYLNLDMARAWQPALSANDASLLREVVFATSGSLEKLVIGRGEDWQYIPCQGNQYSKLKVILLLNEQFQSDIPTEILSPTYAPKLEEITGAPMELDVYNPVHGFVMKRMKSIMLGSDLEVPDGESKEAFGCISGLRRLDLQRYHRDFDEEDPDQEPQGPQELVPLNAFVFPFVFRSLDTLEELHMYVSDLYNLFKMSPALKFPNLRRLSLTQDFFVYFKTQISVLKQLNLARLCPNLEQVEFAAEISNVEVDIDAIGPSEELEQSSHPVLIVLDCEQGSLGMLVSDYLTFFNTVYPNAAQLKILNWKDAYISQWDRITWEMNSLEYLEINIQRPPYRGDEFPWGLDALLCGINKEEAKLLFEGRQKNNATKSAVIVPIFPSLFNAKSLKELKITEGMDRFQVFVKYTCVIEITDNLPVRQKRKLKVIFDGSQEFYNKLKQLRAFSTFRRAQISENYIEDRSMGFLF